MNRKLLILLDVVLVAVVAYVAVQGRDARRAARAREAATLNRPLKPPPPPPFTPLAQAPPVVPSTYINIPEKMLFDRSRNSTVVIEPPPVPPKPPMPPLPSYHGMMNLGGGPTAFFSASADAPHQAMHIGESIGQFKLLGVNSDEITLEWDGQVIHKSVSELTSHVAVANAAQAQQSVRTEGPAAPPAPAAGALSGPGEMSPFGNKRCVVSDGQPEGAVVDGFKKVMHTNPFGQNCTWDPVGK